MAMKLKRTQADKYFSDCIRIRANWKCERCSGDFYGNRGYLDCSHFVTRGEKSVRIHPLNAFSHCKGCHKELGGGKWGGGNVAEFTAHYDARKGEVNRHFITRLARMPFLYYDQYKQDIADHYRLEFRRIEELRKDGNIEWQPFKMYSGSKLLNATMRDIWEELKKEFDESGILKVSKNTGLYKEFAQY